VNVTSVDRGIFQLALFLVNGTPRDRWVGNFLFRLLPQKGGTAIELTPDYGDPYEATAPEPLVQLEDPDDPPDIIGEPMQFHYALRRVRRYG